VRTAHIALGRRRFSLGDCHDVVPKLGGIHMPHENQTARIEVLRL
jgi:hypothetical protein